MGNETWSVVRLWTISPRGDLRHLVRDLDAVDTLDRLRGASHGRSRRATASDGLQIEPALSTDPGRPDQLSARLHCRRLPDRKEATTARPYRQLARTLFALAVAVTDMQVGIISDTHDNVAAIERATAVFEREGVDVVIHCGDFVAPPVIAHFDGFELHGVLGNNDGEIAGLHAAFDALGGESELHGRFADLAFDGVSFGVLHGESLPEVQAIAAAGSYDYVCYGHHHVREQTEKGRTTLLNPGAHFPTVPDDHRTVAIVDTETESVRFRELAD